MVSRTATIPTTTTGQATSGGSSTTVNNSNTSSNTSGSQSGSQNTQQTNMTAVGLSALDALIQGLSGGTRGPVSKGVKQAQQAGQAATQQWQGQIDALNQLAGDYSKSAAFADSDVAVQGALSQALEKSMPTITAGIQAAGTSGSAMSALLTQKAAEDAAYNAAQLGLSAAISYGQIQGNALSSAGGLITSGDPATNQLLAALGINKGSVSNTQTNSSSASNSNTNSATNSTSTTDQAQNQNSTQTTGPTATKNATTDTTPKTTTANLSSTGQNWYTPSSYQDSSYQSGTNSYSQFG